MDVALFLLSALAFAGYALGALMFGRIEFERRNDWHLIPCLLWPMFTIVAVAIWTANTLADTATSRPKDHS